MSTRVTIVTVFILGVIVGAVLLFMLIDRTQPERLDNLRIVPRRKAS